MQVLALSETFGRSDKPPVLDPIPGYKAWNTDRGGSDKGGGGLTLLYRDTVTAHQYTPTVATSQEYVMNERQWLLINSGKDHIAFLHVYIACQNLQNDSFLAWNEDLFFMITEEAKALKQRGFTILAMGDFNSRVGAVPGLEGNTLDHNRNTPLFLNFLNEINLLIINTLPVARGLFTRFMDNSGRPGTQSLLDYGLIDHEKAHTVTSFVIDEKARVDCGSDHALLECVIELTEMPRLRWSFQEPISYNVRKADFPKFQQGLDEALSSLSLSDFSQESSEIMLRHLTEGVNTSAKATFGLKLSKKKRGRKLPRSIISLIKEKNVLARSLLTAGIDNDEKVAAKERLESMKLDIKDKITKMKLQRRSRLRSRLLLADPTRKRFWRFVRGQIKAAGSITALTDRNGAMVFEQEEVEEVVLQHFSTIFDGQRVPVYAPEASPDQTKAALDEIDEILGQHDSGFAPDHFEKQVCAPYSFVELEQILRELPTGKASGYDRYWYCFIEHSVIIKNLYLESQMNFLRIQVPSSNNFFWFS